MGAHVARRRRILALAVLVTVSASACSGDGAPDLVDGAAEIPQRGGRATVAVERLLPAGWTPSDSPCDHSCEVVVAAVIEPLAVLDGSGEPIPHLAESIEPVLDVADDAVPFGSWDVTLRPTPITFSDGTELDVGVIAANLLAHRDGETAASGGVPLHSVEVLDGRTLRVHFARAGDAAGSLAWVEFPAALTGPLGWIVHPDDVAGAPDPLPRGTGPFAVVDATSTTLRLDRRDDHWRTGADGAPLPMLDGIDLEVMPNEAVRRRRTELGGVDLALASEPIGPVAELEPEAPAPTMPDSPEDGLLVGPASDVLAVVFNSAPERADGAPNPWHVLEHRQAVVSCLDVEQLVRSVPGDPTVATGLFSPGVPGHLEEAPASDDDLDGAATLSEADVGTTRLISVVEDDTGALGEAVADQLRKRCDLEVVVVTDGARELDGAVERGEFDLLVRLLEGGPDPDSQFPRWSSASVAGLDDAGANVGRVADERVDEALELVRTVPDPAVRTAAAAELNRALTESARAVWLTWLAPALAVSADLTGLGRDTTPDGVPLRHPTFGAFSLATASRATPVPPP